jgi:hypothetical protein
MNRMQVINKIKIINNLKMKDIKKFDKNKKP